MVFWRIGLASFAFLALLCGAAADELRNARGAVDRALKKDDAGLVDRQSKCPRAVGNLWEYVAKTQIVPLSARATAVLLDTAMCGGGNKHGQYLVIVKDGRSELIDDAEIGDMSFIGRITHAEGNAVFLSGVRWLPDDPHCCPSKDAILEYDVARRSHRFKLSPRNSN